MSPQHAYLVKFIVILTNQKVKIPVDLCSWVCVRTVYQYRPMSYLLVCVAYIQSVTFRVVLSTRTTRTASAEMLKKALALLLGLNTRIENYINNNMLIYMPYLVLELSRQE